MRRQFVLAGLAVIVAGAVAAAFGITALVPPAPAPLAQPSTTVPIVRRTLTDAGAVPAEIGYGEAIPLTSSGPGTVTWLPNVGTVVQRGEPLWRVNEVATVLLYGSVPAFRTLESGVDGADVRQLEENLRALGFTGFAIDRHFGTDTAAAVRRWQERLGQPPTGVVDQNRIVYTPAAVRVAGRLVRVGASASADLVSVTGVTKVVTASVPLAASAWARVEAAVTVVPAGGTATAGVVSGVARSAPGDGGAVVSQIVTVTVPDQAALAGTEAVVRYVIDERRDVLTVPVAALLALPEGGYGLEFADGRTTPVEVGLFADGQVEVRGDDLTAGLEVVVPE